MQRIFTLIKIIGYLPYLFAILIGISSYSFAQSSNQQKSKHPNILFILTDDHRYDGAKALGTSALNTPNLDKLIKQGTAFTHAYILGSDQVCDNKHYLS